MQHPFWESVMPRLSCLRRPQKQGAIAIEILEQNPDIDTIVVPIGGGGPSTGIAVAAVMVEILNEQL